MNHVAEFVQQNKFANFFSMKSILCLGDSYTIGEGVPLHESFPYLLVQSLREANQIFNAPEIVAKTGWTSFELLEHLNNIKLNSTYSFVTMLIGVNNQYRRSEEHTSELQSH